MENLFAFSFGAIQSVHHLQVVGPVEKLFAFSLGAIFGSLINALVYRIPRNQDITFARSRCPKCHHKIRWYHNIPLLSYVFLKGRCHDCGKPIGLRYFFIELLAATATLLLFPTEPNYESIMDFVFKTTVLYTFITIFFIDIDFKIIPNGLNLYLGIIFFTYSFFHLHYSTIILGFFLGGGFPLLVAWAFYLWKKEVGLGGGDIKLFAVLGLYLGPMEIIRTIFLSCSLGSLFVIIGIILKKMDKRTQIPFGPFIVLVASIQILTPAFYHQLKSLIFNIAAI